MLVVKAVVQKVWERSSWDTSKGELLPNTMFHFCLNNVPTDFKEFGQGSRDWGIILDKVLNLLIIKLLAYPCLTSKIKTVSSPDLLDPHGHC